MKHLSIFFALVITSLALFLTGCSAPAATPGDGQMAAPVMVTTATPSGGAADGVSASGQVESVHTAAISTRVMGTITRIYVKIGDKVRQGQLLATISAQDIDAKKAQVDAQITAASAALDNAQKDFDRYTHLYARQSATASELDNATLRYHTAQATLKAAQQLRNEVSATQAYTRLTAPYDGVITQKTADEGSMATPGMPVLTLEQNGTLQISAALAESDINHVRTGDKAWVSIKSTGTETEGIVTQVNSSSVATGGQYTIKVSLPAAAQRSLFAGMFANVVIPGKPGDPKTTQGILVPLSALVQNDQLTGIYTISNTNTALLRWIRTGKTYGDRIEVLSGLEAKERFIVHAAGKLYNGAPVRLQ